MKKNAVLILAGIFLISCSPKSDKVERIMEHGVEVIINHLEPYKIEGEPSELILEEEFRIDSEKEKMVAIGLTDIRGFDVDSEDNIYFFKPPFGREKLIFKFNRDGKFIASFGTKGQGPGEFQWPAYQRITDRDEIPIVDAHRGKVFLLDNNGNIINETEVSHSSAGGGQVIPLENGNYLIGMGGIESPVDFNFILALYDSQFKKLKELDKFIVSRYFRNVFVSPYLLWGVSNGYIYVGNSTKGYEIRIFNLDGKLIRKIKKEYKPVVFSKEVKERIKKLGKRIEIPDYEPPFQRPFFTDDDGRLYIMTYEKGKNSEGHIFDIFNSSGVFIGRRTLNVYVGREYELIYPLYVQSKNNRLYCLREKDSGYKELVVCKMRWE